MPASAMMLADRIAGGGGGGSLVITPFNPSTASPYDISAQSFDDWAIWNTGSGGGTNNLAPSQRKSGGGSTIGNFTSSVAVLRGHASSPYTMSWTGGTPSASGSNNNGIYNDLNDSGTSTAGADQSITFPADTTQRTAYLYAAAFGSDCRLTATLSDASAGPAIDNSMTNGLNITNFSSGWFIITYKAGAAGQTLTLKLESITTYAAYADTEAWAAGWKF